MFGLERLDRRDVLLIAAVGVATGIFVGAISGQPLTGYFFGIFGALNATYYRLRSKR
jgi:asparagine N-glycosylation enzyme membrane subunit Stt3